MSPDRYELEHRLRRDLATLDSVPIGSDRLVETALRSATRRVTRRRYGAIGAMASLVLAGGAGLWLVADDRDVVATTDTVQSSEPSIATSQPPTTPAAPAVIGWRSIAADPRGPVLSPAVVWADGEAVVVGGRTAAGEPVPGAVAYLPSTDTWELLPDPPVDTTEQGLTDRISVWTGREVLLIGGHPADGGQLPAASGLAYDPETRAWRVTAPPLGVLDADSPWAWTGTELLVWPSDTGGSTTGARPVAYDPEADAWHELDEPPVRGRRHAASVWTGSEWIVWGGRGEGGDLGDGAAYDPAAGSWRVLADAPLSPRQVRAVWTGSEMIVAAGSSGGDPVTGNGSFAHGDGAAYDPSTDSWRKLASGPAHPGFEPVWTGTEVLMFAKGGVVIYDPVTDRWAEDCCGPVTTLAPGPPVWTGERALLVGNSDGSAGGAAFTPGGG